MEFTQKRKIKNQSINPFPIRAEECKIDIPGGWNERRGKGAGDLLGVGRQLQIAGSLPSSSTLPRFRRLSLPAVATSLLPSVPFRFSLQRVRIARFQPFSPFDPLWIFRVLFGFCPMILLDPFHLAQFSVVNFRFSEEFRNEPMLRCACCTCVLRCFFLMDFG